MTPGSAWLSELGCVAVQAVTYRPGILVAEPP